MRKIFFIITIFFAIPFLYENKVGAFEYNIQNVSEKFIGKPYVLDPLGEGEDGLFDKSPLYTDEVFDCLTFVESVMAIVKAKSFDKDKIIPVLNKIRYENGVVSYSQRNHITSSDWIENNSKLIKDINAEIAGDKVMQISANIDKAGFLYKQKGLKTKTFVGNVSLNYIPFKNIKSIAGGIPNEAIVFLVENMYLKDKIGTDLLIPHVGFAIRKNGRLYFRHASSVHKNVVDEVFSDYMKKFFSKKNALGITVFRAK